ncbi:MAG TPA: response regulator [Thermoanaerobaculia bacterium]|jgi:CheY-like chemotaxis protein|nr:response regulator [Thermoanaerobaculia bacterium]
MSSDASDTSLPALAELLGSLGKCLYQEGFGAVALLDDDAVLREVNAAFCRLLQFDRPELIGQTLSSFLLPSAKTLGDAALAGLQSRHGFEGEFPVLAADGSLVEVEWRFRPRVAPGLHLAFARDLRPEKQLHRVRRDLEQARLFAVDAVDAKDRFFAALSHELRTPLAPVMLTLSAMQGASDLPERFAPMLERIRRNLELEVRLIDDLLSKGTSSAVAQSVDAGKRPDRARPSDATPHLLLVEDHDDTAEALAVLLHDSGFRVTRASSVADALAAAFQAHTDDQENFHLVLSDLGLPDGDGCDLMRVLSKRHGLKGIALSGYGMDEDIKRALAAGFARHLTKPVDLRHLIDVIREELR